MLDGSDKWDYVFLIGIIIIIVVLIIELGVTAFGADSLATYHRTVNVTTVQADPISGNYFVYSPEGAFVTTNVTMFSQVVPFHRYNISYKLYVPLYQQTGSSPLNGYTGVIKSAKEI